MTKQLKASIAFIALSMVSIPAVFAQTSGILTPTCALNSAAGLGTCLTSIKVWIDGIFWVLAIIFLLYAAFLYLTAAGSEEKLEKAKHALIYAIIACVIAILAFAVQPFLQSIFGVYS